MGFRVGIIACAGVGTRMPYSRTVEEMSWKSHRARQGRMMGEDWRARRPIGSILAALAVRPSRSTALSVEVMSTGTAAVTHK